MINIDFYSPQNDSGACKNVIDFYLLTLKLKDMVRTGWKHWNVSRERLESVAEHIYGVCMLAIAVNSEFNYGIDISKVIKMIVVHELEEILISDITPFQGISVEEKQLSGHIAIRKILSPLIEGKTYIKLIEEFDARETSEAKFAYQCDKLEADLMAIKYNTEKEVTYENVDSTLKENNQLKKYAEEGARTMAEFFYLYDKDKFDRNFKEILDYLMFKIR